MNIRLLNVALIALGLSGCATLVDPKFDEAAAPPVETILCDCCSAPATLPRGIVRALERDAENVIPLIRSVRFREPYLQKHPAAQARVLEAAQPLDVMLFTLSAELSGRTLSGYFDHIGIYLGTERQLKNIGLWDHPVIRPFQPAIRDGGVMIEAAGDRVRLVGGDTIFESDSVALFAPSRLSPQMRRNQLVKLVQAIETPFDFHFDMNTEDELFCAELVERVMPDVAMPVREILGRQTVLPDELAADALLGRNSLEFRGFVYGLPDGWGVGSSTLLAQTIANAWTPTSQR